MKKRLLMILASVVLATSVVAADAFSYKLLFEGTSAEETLYAFGRKDDAKDTLDEYDFSAPPGTPDDPNGGTMQYIAFHSVMGTTGPATADGALQKLSTDYRSTANAASTWTMDLSNPSHVSLSWEPESEGTALTAKGASLMLVKPDGTTVNMKTTTTLDNPASGRYYIKYKQSATTQDAPATPPLIEAEMAIYEGGSISFKVLDPTKYEFAGNPPCTIAFFQGEGTTRVKLQDISETDGLAVDSETGCITYTFDTALPKYDEIVITYCFRYRNGTRAESSALAYGSVRSVNVAKPVIIMRSDATLSVDTKSEEAGADTCTLSYELIFPSAEPEGRTIDAGHPLPVFATLTVPPNFVEGTSEELEEVSREPNADGSQSVTFKYQATSNGFTLNFTLTAQEGAKKATASLAVACNFPAAQAVNLPEDEDITTTTATITVRGAGNLGVDGDEYINYKDAYLIGYFIDQLANVPDIYETAEDIPAEDILGHLADEYSAEKAQEIKDNLIALAAGGMLDVTGDGFTNYIDQYLIGYFIDQLANVPDIYETAADIPVEDILGHLAGEFTPAQGEQIKQRLLDLVP